MGAWGKQLGPGLEGGVWGRGGRGGCGSTSLAVPAGAGQDVGRSCILVSIGGKNVMLDCGMHMGFNDDVSLWVGCPEALGGQQGITQPAPRGGCRTQSLRLPPVGCGQAGHMGSAGHRWDWWRCIPGQHRPSRDRRGALHRGRSVWRGSWASSGLCGLGWARLLVLVSDSSCALGGHQQSAGLGQPPDRGVGVQRLAGMLAVPPVPRGPGQPLHPDAFSQLLRGGSPTSPTSPATAG